MSGALALNVGDLLRWWGTELAATLPGGVWAALAREPVADALLFTFAEKSVALTLRRSQVERDLGHFALDDAGLQALRHVPELKPPQTLPVWLRAPAHSVLAKTIPLPAAARGSVARILAYEMDRETPFTADELAWSWRPLPAATLPGQQGLLRVRLVAVPRLTLLPLADALAPLGLTPSAVEVFDTELDRALSVPLAPETDASAANSRTLRRSAAVLAILSILAVALPFLRQESTALALDRRLEALTPALAQAQRLNHDLEAGSAGEGVIDAERTRWGEPLSVLASVTDALPDDCSLNAFTLKDGTVTMTGHAASAAVLLTTLASNAQLRNPSFTAPVLHEDGGHIDVFSIAASIGTDKGGRSAR